jgi:hypothetical protein
VFFDKIKTFYINLDLREDRYKHITRECRRMGLMSCEKFSAIKPKIEDVRESNMINIEPKEGMLIFTNSWLAHSFSRNASNKNMQFIHFTVTPQQINNIVASSNAEII